MSATKRATSAVSSEKPSPGVSTVRHAVASRSGAIELARDKRAGMVLLREDQRRRMTESPGERGRLSHAAGPDLAIEQRKRGFQLHGHFGPGSCKVHQIFLQRGIVAFRRQLRTANRMSTTLVRIA